MWKGKIIRSVLAGFYLALENQEDLPSKQLQMFFLAGDDSTGDMYSKASVI